MRGGCSIKSLDEVPTEEVMRFRYKDGRTASIWEKWVELSPHYLVFHNRWDPGALSPHHGHTGDHGILMLAGEIRSHQGQVCRAGDHIMLEYGDQFGPWEAGPEGAEMYGWVAGGHGFAYPGDMELWDAYLKERGAVVEPTEKPRRLPYWYVPRANNFGRGWS